MQTVRISGQFDRKYAAPRDRRPPRGIYSRARTAETNLLLGADLHKDASFIDKAYNDSAGFGPRSTLNMLHHLNRRYDGNFVMDNFRYRSKYDPRLKRNEVRIESLAAQTVTLASLDFTMALAEGELIDAEIMWKFEPDELCSLLDRAGFSLVNRWIELLYRYGLFLFAADDIHRRLISNRR